MPFVVRKSFQVFNVYTLLRPSHHWRSALRRRSTVLWRLHIACPPSGSRWHDLRASDVCVLAETRRCVWYRSDLVPELLRPGAKITPLSLAVRVRTRKHSVQTLHWAQLRLPGNIRPLNAEPDSREGLAGSRGGKWGAWIAGMVGHRKRRLSRYIAGPSRWEYKLFLADMGLVQAFSLFCSVLLSFLILMDMLLIVSCIVPLAFGGFLAQMH